MESPRSARTRTPACTVPSVLVGLTKLCKLTKVCAAPAQDKDDEAATTSGPPPGDLGGYEQRLILVRLFEAMATLKSAYVKLQKAHIPYDPIKIAVADDTITSELDSVTALQRLCSSSKSGDSIGVLINERWSVVQKLEAETRRRDSEIVVLKRELEGVRRENARMNRQIKSGEGNLASVDSKHYCGKGYLAVGNKELALATMTPSALVEVFKAAVTSVHEFAGLVFAASVASSSSDGCCARSRTIAEEKSSWNKRYSFEAHLWRTMTGRNKGVEEEEEEEEEFNNAAHFDRIMRCCDPIDALIQHPSSSFSRFCHRKYLAAVPSEMESAMFGNNNLEQRAFVSRGGHPRTWFYRAFATMARSAWALRVLMEKHHCSASAGWGVVVFYARRGSRYEEEVMESVNGVVPAFVGRHHGEEKIGVAFSVTPGLKIGGDTVVKCRVVLCHPEHREAQY
ncbi:hypothetical protein QOZ80_9BG0696020 [Eleusine coracana subsp. coracana]|nr:hypothetical protein QOZ80_9BG0696020 [Eleusine coracana subsp. coracana]